MSENTQIVEQKQGEPVVTATEVKADPFAILETEPIFASDEKGGVAATKPVTETTVTKTEQELADEKAAADKQAAESATQLATEAKELGLAETATKEEIDSAKLKVADELKVKAKELGLAETATKEEITAAELKKAETEGFVTQDEVNTGILGAEDGTWKAVMLAEGLNVPDDYTEEKGFELYKQAETAKWQVEIEKAKAEVQESMFAKLKPDVAAALELANSIPDMSLEQILSPTIRIDNYLKLDKEALVRADLEATFKDMKPEMIDLKMQEIKDANQLDIRDEMIRIELNKNKTDIQNFHTQKIQEYQAKQLQEKSAAEKGKIEQVIKALDRVPTFLDKKITQTDRQFISNKINNGLITDLVNNPEKLAKAAIMLEFYDKGIASYEDRVREKLSLEHKQKLHNTSTVTAGGANQVVTTKPITNQFDILKEDFGEK